MLLVSECSVTEKFKSNVVCKMIQMESFLNDSITKKKKYCFERFNVFTYSWVDDLVHYSQNAKQILLCVCTQFSSEVPITQQISSLLRAI